MTPSIIYVITTYMPIHFSLVGKRIKAIGLIKILSINQTLMYGIFELEMVNMPYGIPSFTEEAEVSFLN